MRAAPAAPKIKGVRMFGARLALCVSALAFVTGTACPQPYPHRPFRMLAPEAGGGNDLVARTLAQALAASFGQAVIVDNRGSAGGIVAAQILARSPADGHTLM